MSMNLLKVIQVQKIGKYWFATVVTGALLGGALLSKAETPDTFTRHGLPIPGAYFENKASQQPATVGVSKSGQGLGEQKQTATKLSKRHTH
jgi:hypothetical protein